MTTEFTPDRIAELRALAEKATPGPWKQHLVDDTCVIDHHGNTVAETFPDGGKDDDIDYNTNAEQKELDAAFIAAARDALPRALDTIEAQAAGLAERDAEIARLREALAEACSAKNAEYENAEYEANAKWHDDAAEHCRKEAASRSRADIDYWYYDGEAEKHEDSARFIRALKTPLVCRELPASPVEGRASAGHDTQGDAIARLTRERDEARAAQASARNDALEEAAKWHDHKSAIARKEAASRRIEDGDYWHFDGLADQHRSYAAAIRAMKREPAVGHEGSAVTHKSEAPDTIAIPRKLLTEAHAVMRAHGWQLAPASATSDDGVIEAAAAEIEDRFAELLGAREP